MKRRFRKLKPVTNNPEYTPGHECKADKIPTHREVVVNGSVKIDGLEELSTNYKSAHKDDPAHDERDYLLACITAALIAIYAGLTFWQGCETRKIAEIAARQLELSERPWVGIKGQPDFQHLGFTHIQDGPIRLQGTLSYTLENTGNSPALKVFENISPVVTVDNDIPKEWKVQACDIPEQVSTGMVRESGIAIMPKSATDKPHPITISSPVPMEMKQADFVWIEGCITYRGISDKVHHTRLLYLARTTKPVVFTNLTANDFTPFTISTLQLGDSDAD